MRVVFGLAPPYPTRKLSTFPNCVANGDRLVTIWYGFEHILYHCLNTDAHRVYWVELGEEKSTGKARRYYSSGGHWSPPLRMDKTHALGMNTILENNHHHGDWGN